MATERTRFAFRQPRIDTPEAKYVTATLDAMWTHEKFATDWATQFVLNPRRHFVLRILEWHNSIRARARKFSHQLYVKIISLLVVWATQFEKLLYSGARDGSGQNPTRNLTRPEAFLANPT